MISKWFPEPYKITTLEEINTVGFERHQDFRSISEFIDTWKYFIIDLTIINKIRARNKPVTENDISLVHELLRYSTSGDKKIILLIAPQIKQFTAYYSGLCSLLNDFGIDYFHNGKYAKLPHIKEIGND
jgi:hypothetical protein